MGARTFILALRDDSCDTSRVQNCVDVGIQRHCTTLHCEPQRDGAPWCAAGGTHRSCQDEEPKGKGMEHLVRSGSSGGHPPPARHEQCEPWGVNTNGYRKHWLASRRFALCRVPAGAVNIPRGTSAPNCILLRLDLCPALWKSVSRSILESYTQTQCRCHLFQADTQHSSYQICVHCNPRLCNQGFTFSPKFCED